MTDTRPSEISVELGRLTYKVNRPRLKKYLCLAEIRERFVDAAKDHDAEAASSRIIEYIEAAIESSINANLPWQEIAEAYLRLLDLCELLIQPPLLMYSSRTPKKDAWDYDGRTWYMWSHLFARKYGWSLEYIAELVPDDAIALLQEIFIEDQLRQEWEWSLSEVSYKKEGDKVRHVPLPRPAWMSLAAASKKEVKKVKIRRDFIPVGNVIRLGANENPDDT